MVWSMPSTIMAAMMAGSGKRGIASGMNSRAPTTIRKMMRSAPSAFIDLLPPVTTPSGRMVRARSLVAPVRLGCLRRTDPEFLDDRAAGRNRLAGPPGAIADQPDDNRQDRQRRDDEDDF